MITHFCKQHYTVSVIHSPMQQNETQQLQVFKNDHIILDTVSDK